jgi:hypothetical protein
LKETPRRRITVMSSLKNKIFEDQLGNRVAVREVEALLLSSEAFWKDI